MQCVRAPVTVCNALCLTVAVPVTMPVLLQDQGT